MTEDRILSDRAHQRVLDQSRQTLEASIEGQASLDARLDQARAAALSPQPATRPFGYLPWAGGLVAAGIALLVVTLPDSGEQPVRLDSPEVVMTLTDLDDTEWNMVQDFDFALWLSELDPSELENLSSI